MPSNIVDYGTPQEPNLDEISKSVFQSLKGYNKLFILANPDIYICGESTLTLTPDKPNSARATFDVIYGDGKNQRKLGDLYVILFAPGDGTGKSGDYTSVEIPLEYKFETKPERVLPRNKLSEKVLCEAILPLFSVERTKFFPYAVSLEQVTISDKVTPTRLVRGLEVGLPAEDYLRFVDNPTLGARLLLDSASSFSLPSKPFLNFQLTCGYHRNGQRFGDPHATFYNPKLAEGHPHRMQVAGFLAVEDADNPLCKALDEIGIVPKQKR